MGQTEQRHRPRWRSNDVASNSRARNARRFETTLGRCKVDTGNFTVCWRIGNLGGRTFSRLLKISFFSEGRGFRLCVKTRDSLWVVALATTYASRIRAALAAEVQILQAITQDL